MPTTGDGARIMLLVGQKQTGTDNFFWLKRAQFLRLKLVSLQSNISEREKH
jgi:hypothetical protein